MFCIVLKSKFNPIPESLSVKDSYMFIYGDNAEIEVTTDVLDNIEDLKLVATSSMTDIVDFENNIVSFNKNGKAVIKLVSKLPGEAVLKFNIEGTDISVETKINIIIEDEESKEDYFVDVNNDGIVDILDLSLVAIKYGTYFIDDEKGFR